MRLRIAFYFNSPVDKKSNLYVYSPIVPLVLLAHKIWTCPSRNELVARLVEGQLSLLSPPAIITLRQRGGEDEQEEHVGGREGR